MRRTCPCGIGIGWLQSHIGCQFQQHSCIVFLLYDLTPTGMKCERHTLKPSCPELQLDGGGRFMGAKGSLVDFRQVLLSSSALDACLSRCQATSAGPEAFAGLERLLLRVLPPSSGVMTLFLT